MAESQTPAFELTYFDTHGRGLQIRLLLTLSGTEFVDTRISQAEWPAIKETMPWRQIPVLRHGDEQVWGSCAIMRYAGKQVGMWPTEELAQVRSIALLNSVEEVWASLSKFARIKNPLRWVWEARKMISSELPTNCDLFQMHLGGDYFLGDEMSAVDFGVFSLFSVILDRAGNRGARKIIEARPALNAFIQRMAADPRIDSYMRGTQDKKL